MEPRGGAPEMQFVGQHREVTQHTHVHIANVSRASVKNIVQSTFGL
jgi:hypothetical protein